MSKKVKAKGFFEKKRPSNVKRTPILRILILLIVIALLGFAIFLIVSKIIGAVSKVDAEDSLTKMFKDGELKARRLYYIYSK